MLPFPSNRAISPLPRTRFPLLLAFVGLGSAVVVHSGAVRTAAPTCPGPAVGPAVHAAAEASMDELAGIWWRYEAGAEGAPVRFYYFHGDGKGLYRYGRVGLNNTHSFDYELDGDVVVLRFRKTGETHRVPYAVTRRGARDYLVLTDDPEESGATRYFREQHGPIDPHTDPADSSPGTPPSGHMWIDDRRFATGGAGFSFYQFRSSGIDGRGVGWFHRGDFDDWSTESFTYRIVGDALSLHFTLSDQRAITSFSVSDTEPRVLSVADDPRDFWHRHSYQDAGPSFGATHIAATNEFAFVAAMAGP